MTPRCSAVSLHGRKRELIIIQLSSRAAPLVRQLAVHATKMRLGRLRCPCRRSRPCLCRRRSTLHATRLLRLLMAAEQPP